MIKHPLSLLIGIMFITHHPIHKNTTKVQGHQHHQLLVSRQHPEEESLALHPQPPPHLHLPPHPHRLSLVVPLKPLGNENVERQIWMMMISQIIIINLEVVQQQRQQQLLLLLL